MKVLMLCCILSFNLNYLGYFLSIIKVEYFMKTR